MTDKTVPIYTGCPKKNGDFVMFWVFDLGRGVSRSKNIRLFSKISNYSKSSIIFEFSWLGQFQNVKNHLKGQNKQCPFTQNFIKQPQFFLFPKFLELIFTPQNTPPKVKNCECTLLPRMF